MDGRTPIPNKSLNAYLLSPVETTPNAGFTSLYDSAKELSCTVCSKWSVYELTHIPAVCFHWANFSTINLVYTC